MNKIAKQLGKYFILWLISGFILIVFIFGTRPLSLALPVLLIPFAVFFVWVRSSVIGAGILLRGLKQPTRKLRILASFIASVALIVITLQSLGQLTWRDLILATSLVLGLMFYLAKTDII